MPHVDRLERVTEALRRGVPVPHDETSWLLDGLTKWKESGGKLSLENALGIQNAPDWEAIRNEWIRKAAASIEKPSAWKVACALSEEIKEFRDNVWPNTKHLSEPPTLSSRRYALWQAVKANSYLPSKNDERRFPTVPQAIANLIRPPT